MPDVDDVAASGGKCGGLTIVKARAFGKDREFQLIGRRGHHAMSRACDGGPATMVMLTSADVFQESLPTFMRFMKANDVASVESD